jgi:hypothetical protein
MSNPPDEGGSCKPTLYTIPTGTFELEGDGGIDLRKG